MCQLINCRFLDGAKVMMKKYLVRAYWLLIYMGWNLGSTVETIKTEWSVKNVVWIYWMKSRCLYICTVAFLQYIAALAAHNLSQYKGQCASRCSCSADEYYVIIF